MIEEYDRVIIKSTGLVGDVVDICEVGGKPLYTIESAERVDGIYPLFSCRLEELAEVPKEVRTITYSKDMWVLGHLDWYTHVVGYGFKPTESAPPKAVEAIERLNEYIKKKYG